jgi:dTDP-glucose pyrophosphorylase
MKNELEAYIVSDSMTVIDAMSVINDNARGIAFVCHDMVLNGSVTDGNIRRYILKSGDMYAPVSAVMNSSPKYIDHHDNIDPKQFMADNHINAVPIVNSRHEIISIHFLNEHQVYKSTDLNVPVVIMAGGKGTRLLPFTSVLPKPLIPVGDKTVIERIMGKFTFFGCNEFNIIVNYKRHLIKAFFDDAGRDRGDEHSVVFTDEKEYNGTGGGLSLLKGQLAGTFFMTNCDIIIEEDYSEIIRHHRAHRNIITMVAAMKNIQLNYGTVDVSDSGLVTGLSEKPNISMLVNTGLYIIEPRFLDYIPNDTFIHITDVIEKCIAAGERVGAYPISESSWYDMGEMGEFEKMMEHFGE